MLIEFPIPLTLLSMVWLQTSIKQPTKTGLKELIAQSDQREASLQPTDSNNHLEEYIMGRDLFEMQL